MDWKIVITIKPHFHHKHLWMGSYVRFEDLSIVNLFLFVGLPSLIHSPSSLLLFDLNPNSKILRETLFSSRVFAVFSCFGTVYAPEAILWIQSFLFWVRIRQFQVITCSTFLNDLCFQILFIKKPSLSRLYNVKCYKNVKFIFFNLYWKN